MKLSNNFFLKILIIAIFSSVILSCKDKNDVSNDSDNSKSVIVKKIRSLSQHQILKVGGNVEGNKTINLGFMVPGRIKSINFDLGQNVKKGELVASLDPSDYKIAKEIIDIQVSQAKDEYDRLKIMYQRNSISESDFKKIEFTYQSALAQQKLKNKNLADTKVFAPFDAILLKKNAETGEIVSSVMPVLILSDISVVKVNAYVPENQLNEIKLGKDVKVNIDALNKIFNGKVIEISGSADFTTRAFTVVVAVQNPKGLIKPGMIAEVEISSNEKKSIITIPANSILKTPEGQPYVFIFRNGKAYKREISIGSIYGETIEVITGLTNDEILIVGGQNKLTNGSVVLVTK